MLTIISLLKHGKKPKDWCEYLQANPDLLQDTLRTFYDPSTAVSVTQTNSSAAALSISIGSDTVTIPTCISSRTSVDSHILNQWIADLDRS